MEERKYIVLQGAPGTGKTRLAKLLTENANSENVFFTQFHAETSYADFVYGILPNVDSKNQLLYTQNDGIFVKAIERANNRPYESVYLIIDEINRANLSNVLGQAFYLFEPTMADSNVEVYVTPKLKLSKLPENLYVIATMNTADRSLAVVDFALRRRFAWYTMTPHTITPDYGYYFAKQQFDKISEIFEKYATDDELNLQPGHAYFIARDTANREAIIKNRLKYEVMPLVKEYLINGIMTRAKDDFVGFFRDEINEEIFK